VATSFQLEGRSVRGALAFEHLRRVHLDERGNVVNQEVAERSALAHPRRAGAPDVIFMLHRPRRTDACSSRAGELTGIDPHVQARLTAALVVCRRTFPPRAEGRYRAKVSTVTIFTCPTPYLSR